MSTHSSDATPMVTTAPSTTDILTSINNTDRISDFMECIPLEIRMEIYPMIGRYFINETCGNFDYDRVHQDGGNHREEKRDYYNYFEKYWYGPGGYQVIKAYELLEPQIKIAAIMNDTDALHMLLSKIKDIFPQRTDQTLLPKDEDSPYYHDFRDGDTFIKYGAARILAKHGRLKVLKWYCNEYGIGLQDDLCEIAVFYGHRHILAWMMQQDSMAGIKKWKLYMQAASTGNRKLLEWLRAQGYPWNAEICKEAAKYGRLETLRYLHEQGCPWDEDTCIVAARIGHLEALQFAHEHGCPWNARTCSEAVSSWNGLEILRYLHEQGCPWNEDTCSEAARQGRFDLLRYAHEHGCPWNEETIRNSRNQLEIRAYLREHGCPGSQAIDDSLEVGQDDEIENDEYEE